MIEDPTAFAWEGFKHNDTAILGSYELTLAKTTKEVIKALQNYGSAGEGLVFATSQGDIGYKGVGTNYKRAYSIKQSNYFLDGTDPKNDWIEKIPENLAPLIVNPTKGYIVNCNNKILPENMTEYGIGATMVGNVRANRADFMIKKIMGEIKEGKRQKFDINDMIEIQNDFYDMWAEKIIPVLTLLTKTHFKRYENISINPSKIYEMINLISKWDYKILKDRVEPLIYSVWIIELKKLMLHKYFDDENVRENHANSYSADTFIGNMIFEWGRKNMLDSDLCLNELNRNYTEKCLFNLVYSLEKSREFIEKLLGPHIVFLY